MDKHYIFLLQRDNMKQNKIESYSIYSNTLKKTPIIIGKNVSFSYNGEKIFEFVNFEILHKEFLGIIGPTVAEKQLL